MNHKNDALGRQMKVSELSRASNVAPSAIHYYVHMGVLHRPKKVGLNLHLYDESHVARLRQIRQLKERKGLTLAEIKQLLEQGESERAGSPPASQVQGPQAVEAASPGRETEAQREERENREKILDMAIRLFSERGYENTKVSDITEALRMGKGTFYAYFKNKRELFIDCIDRLGVAIVPRESWDEIREERDYVAKNTKRGEAFLRAFPGYRGILNMVRGAIGGTDPVLAQKAIEGFRVLSKPLLKDLRRATGDGAVRIKHDEAFVAFLQLIIAEAFGYWQMIDPRYSIEEGMQIIMDIMRHGLIDAGPFHDGDGAEQGPAGEVEDGTGLKTRLEDLSVDGTHAFRGRMGDAEAVVDLGKLASARFREEGQRFLARLTTRDGQSLEVEMDADVHLSGKAPFGSLRIPLRRIVSVGFDEG
jgi:AcrR family transcriptional regulator